jgi:branched-subunit amino acid aminotransferase/4-amino-4-deoxychorismate lyase
MTQMAYCLGLRQKDPTGRNIHEFMAFLDTPAARTGWRLFLRELTTLTLELRQAKVKVLWVVFPYSYQLGPNLWQVDLSRWPTDPQKRLAEEAKKLGVELADLLPAFKSASQKGQSIYVLLDANHPNEQGHAVAGRALYQWLVRLLS